jgi:hypothetical protein
VKIVLYPLRAPTGAPKVAEVRYRGRTFEVDCADAELAFRLHAYFSLPAPTGAVGPNGEDLRGQTEPGTEAHVREKLVRLYQLGLRGRLER